MVRRYLPSRQSRTMFEDVEIRGMNIDEVATKWDVTPQSVYQALERVRDFLREHYRKQAHDPEGLAVKHLERLEYQWQEAMRAWYRSQLDEQTTRLSQLAGDQSPGKLEQTLRTAVGDVRFLQLAQRILADIRELIGDKSSVFSLPQEQEDDEDLTFDQRRAELYRVLGVDGFDGSAGEGGGTDPGEEEEEETVE